MREAKWVLKTKSYRMLHACFYFHYAIRRGGRGRRTGRPSSLALLSRRQPVVGRPEKRLREELGWAKLGLGGKWADEREDANDSCRVVEVGSISGGRFASLRAFFFFFVSHAREDGKQCRQAGVNDDDDDNKTKHRHTHCRKMLVKNQSTTQRERGWSKFPFF